MRSPQDHFRKWLPIALFALGLIFAAVFLAKRPGALVFAFASQTGNTRRTPRGRAGAATSARESAMPFQVGETLDYRIGWSSFANAASLELSVPERRNLYGWQTWHFRAALHTVRPARALFAIDDQFDSYTDISSLESRQFEIYRSELGKKEVEVSHLVAKGQRSSAPGGAVVVLPGTQDPLGAIFALRGVDWQHRLEVRVPVYDGHDIYEMRARLDRVPEDVRVEAGNFRASRVVIEAFQSGKQDSAIQAALWIADDRDRTPILITAQLGFGDVRVELISARPGTAGSP